MPRVVNRGVSGATVAIAATGSGGISIGTLIAGTVTYEPVTNVLLNWGVNDWSHGLPNQTTWQNNYITIVEAVHAAYPAAAIWIARPWDLGFDASADTIAGWIPNVVAAHPAYTFLGMDERSWFKPNVATYSDDGVHYNAAGKAAAATAWKTALGY